MAITMLIKENDPLYTLRDPSQCSIHRTTEGDFVVIDHSIQTAIAKAPTAEELTVFVVVETKTTELRETLDSIFGNYGFQPYSQARKTQTCVACKGEAVEFKDDISRREYGISGLCQKCQDEVFNVEEW